MPLPLCLNPMWERFSFKLDTKSSILLGLTESTATKLGQPAFWKSVRIGRMEVALVEIDLQTRPRKLSCPVSGSQEGTSREELTAVGDWKPRMLNSRT